MERNIKLIRNFESYSGFKLLKLEAWRQPVRRFQAEGVNIAARPGCMILKLKDFKFDFIDSVFSLQVLIIVGHRFFANEL